MRTKSNLLLCLALIGGIACIAYFVKNNSVSSKETVVVFGEASSNLKAYQTLKDDFAIRSGIQLKFEGATFEQAVQKADADFRNGKGDYDIVLQYNFSLAPYVKKNGSPLFGVESSVRSS